ncbi:hypothetical protein DL96DRAFT_1551400 [Flagelloscypha sp. PMI_526]|nr:hypothetical protein DL96DRAFT_1551400 [Flagelloscypha sp. PMI_526]
MFPRLETFPFKIFFPYDSSESVWFNWMANCLQSATFLLPLSSLPFEKIYSTISLLLRSSGPFLSWDQARNLKFNIVEGTGVVVAGVECAPFALVIAPKFETAVEFLFCHLHLQVTGATWKTQLSQCDFFLAKENDHLFSRIRNLSIDPEGLPVFEENPVPAQLKRLLIKLGSQVNSLRITGAPNRGWKELSLAFRSCISTYVLPYLNILELPEFVMVPIFQLLQNTPHLRHLHLGSGMNPLSPNLVGESYKKSFYRGLVSLSVGPFEELDFHVETSLSKIIECSGGNIATFHLGSHWNDLCPPSLKFLSPFPDFTSHILHFSIGEDLFYQANQSSQWFNWIAKSLHSTILSNSPATLPLKRLQFTSTPGDAIQRPIELYILENELDDLAHNPGISCSLEFRISLSEGQEKNEYIFTDLREDLFPAWDQMGRLKLWVEI